jgi:hypothetical protein
MRQHVRNFGVTLIAAVFLAAGPLGAAEETAVQARSWQTLLPESAQTVPAACCKTCRKGKACGDSYISRTMTCRKPPGCACDATGKGAWPEDAGAQSFPVTPRFRGALSAGA